MAARCSAEAVTQAIEKLGVQAQVSVASVNGPKSVVAAGAEAEVLMVMRELGQEGQRLSVSHAFHSPLMMPMAEEFRAVVASLLESEHCRAPIHNPSGEHGDGQRGLCRRAGRSGALGAASVVAGAVLGRIGGGAGPVVRRSIQPCVVLEVGPNPVLSRMARPWVGSGRVAAWCASLDRQARVDDVEAMRRRRRIWTSTSTQPPTAIGVLDRVFPNRKAFPWQAPPHPLLQQTQVIEDDGVTGIKAVIHEALMDVYKDFTLEGRCIFPGSWLFRDGKRGTFDNTLDDL